MANRANRNNVEESAEDIHNDVSQLADTLEEVLKSWGSDAMGCADSYVRDKPWQSVGAAAAVGVFIGVLLNLRR